VKTRRLPRPFSIFHAEAEAINTTISITRITIQPKRGILSDLQPQGGENPNPPREGAPDSHVVFGIRRENTPTRTTKPLQKTGKTG
jgi:hypothetical protein